MSEWIRVRSALARRAGREQRVSGVALVWRDAAPLFSYAGGIAHRGHSVPITNETRFGVASVTKMVTATTALRLVDRGELQLEQPLTEILPAEHRTRRKFTSGQHGLPGAIMVRSRSAPSSERSRGGHARDDSSFHT